MFRLFFRLGIFLQLIVVLILATLLVLPVLMHPGTHSAIETLMFNSLGLQALVDSPVIGVAIVAVIMLFQAFFLYFFLGSNDLHPRDSMLAVLFYFILAAGLKESILLSPALAASVLLLFSLFLIVRMHGNVIAYKQVFSASFCVSLAAIFYPPAIIFVFFIWLSFLTYRIASWHEWIISFIGFSIPLVYLLTYYFWVGKLQVFISGYSSHFIPMTNEWPKFSVWPLIFLVFSGVLLLLSMFRQIVLIQDKLISIRRKTWVIIDFLVVSIFSSLLSAGNFPGHLAIIALPGALFIANMITGKRVNWAFEILAGLMVILLLLERVF